VAPANPPRYRRNPRSQQAEGVSVASVRRCGCVERTNVKWGARRRRRLGDNRGGPTRGATMSLSASGAVGVAATRWPRLPFEAERRRHDQALHPNVSLSPHQLAPHFALLSLLRITPVTSHQVQNRAAKPSSTPPAPLIQRPILLRLAHPSSFSAAFELFRYPSIAMHTPS